MLFRLFWLFVLLSSAASLRAQDEALLAMPGRLVSVGTHRLHIYCTGTKEPTVIIDSGLGGFSLEWNNIQSSLSESLRVCTYDRAGYGWSDPGPGPRTTQQIASELHTLLINAEVPGPYILVGHSFGGYNIRYYASTYPETLLGLVLIDASHPEQFDRMPQVAVKPQVKRRNSWSVPIARPRLPDNYPAQARQRAFLLMASYKVAQAQRDELEHFRFSAQQVEHADHLPDVAMTVVSRGLRVWPQNEFGDRSEQVWAEMQDELSHLTSHARQVIAGHSGHLVHLDEPAVVISAIIKTAQSAQVIEAVRLARLQLLKTLPPERQMLLVGNQIPEWPDLRYGYTLDGIEQYSAGLSHTGLTLPY